MSGITSDTVLAVFLVFCRIGTCLMMTPGFSSTRIPMRVRLFLAIAVTLALAPILVPKVAPLIGDGAPAAMTSAIGSEVLIGLLVGFMARLFLMALQTIAVSASQAIGLSGVPGLSIDDDDHVPALASLFTLTAVTMMFITNQHWLILRGLIDSYNSIPPIGRFDVQAGLIDVANQISAVFLLALRIGSPFLIYSIVINFAVGITNKLSPQIPVFFIAMPFVTAGGLLLLAFTVHELLASFIAGFGTWLAAG